MHNHLNEAPQSSPALKTASSQPGYELKISHHTLTFSSAHILIDHDKCGHLHGHNYRVSLQLAGPLNEKSMVIDFIKVKQLIREECSLLDHKILVPLKSPFVEINIDNKSVKLNSKTKQYIFPRMDCILLDIPAVTSELLAYYFWHRLRPKLAAIQYSVFIEETPGAFAKYGTL